MRDAVSYLPVVVREYGCVRCQGDHREGEPLYAEHLPWQSRHGIREVDVYEAIILAAARAATRPG